MNEDRVIGTARNIGGQAQEGFGRITGDAKSQVEGVFNQAAGAAQDLYGQAQDLYGHAKETASDAAQVVRRGAVDAEDFVRHTIEQRPLHDGIRGALYRLVHRPHGTARLTTTS